MQVTNVHRALAQQIGWLNTGRRLTAEDLKGRIILLDFWTFCCINCMHIIPNLKYLEETFGDDLTVIGVHSAKFKNEQDTQNIRNAILRYGIEHSVVNDFDFSIWQSFGVRAWPTLMLINPTGTIEQIYSGEGHREAIEQDVKRLREKYAGKYVTSPLPMALEKNKEPDTPLRFPGKLAFTSGFFGPEAVLAVADSGHHRIAILNEDGSIRLIVGSGREGFRDGSLEQAEFRSPQGILFVHDGNGDSKDPTLYVADTGNHAIRRIDFALNKVQTIAGTGEQGYNRTAYNAPALKTKLASPWDLAFFPDKNHIAIAMAGTHQLWSYDIKNQTLSVIAGNGRESIDDGKYPLNSLSQPSGLSAYADKLYFVDSETSALRVMDKAGDITTLIGTGLFDFGYKEGGKGEALLQHPLGVFADETGMYIADSYNHSIRRFDPEMKILHNFAGRGVRGTKDSVLTQAEFNEPGDVHKINNTLYVADTNNHAIRMLDLKAGTVRTLDISRLKLKDETDPEKALPNLEILPSIILQSGKAIPITFNLSPGWHLNEEAPSTLTLLVKEENNWKNLTIFDRDTLRGPKTDLPALIPGISYRLRGTLYYCEDKAESQCLITSVEIPITASAKGLPLLAIPLN